MSSSAHRKHDAGWAWVIVASAFVSRVLHDGIYKSMGVLLPTLSAYFDVPVWSIGYIISLMSVIGGIVGIITTSLEKSLPPRITVMVGGVLAAAGFIISSYSNSWNLISVYLIVLTGVGVRYSNLILMGILGDYFNKRYSLANSIAVSGTSVGVLIFAPMTQLFLDEYGWRGSFLLLGAVCLHLSVCGSLLRHDTTQKGQKPDIKDNEVTDSPSGCWVRFLRKVSVCVSDFELKLFRNGVFLIWLSTNCLLEYTWAGWLIYLIPHAEDKGLSPYKATSLATAAGIGFLLGLYPSGHVVDLKWRYCGAHELRVATLLLGGISLFIDPLFDSLGVLMFLSILFGAAIGSLKVTSYSVAKDIEGDLTQVLSWSFTFVSIAKLASGFMTGWLYDYTNSYDVSFIVLGAVMIFASLLEMLYVIYKWKQHLRRSTATETTPLIY